MASPHALTPVSAALRGGVRRHAGRTAGAALAGAIAACRAAATHVPPHARRHTSCRAAGLSSASVAGEVGKEEGEEEEEEVAALHHEEEEGQRRGERDGGVPGGTLAVVATPIGNLSDLTLRAARVLAGAAVIAAEDTRVTRRLLASIPRLFPGVCPAAMASQSLVICNAHTAADRVPLLLSHLARRDVVALVSDAGTPGISDPGAEIVAAVRAAGFPVVPLPGACAATAALSAAGVPMTAGFAFVGFLPRDGSARRAALQSLALRVRSWARAPSPAAAPPVVLYEAPHRLVRTLDDLASLLPPAVNVILARELTKVYESVSVFPSPAAAAAAVRATPPRGEYVAILAAAAPATTGGTLSPPLLAAAAAEGANYDSMSLDDALALVGEALARSPGRRASDAIAAVVEATGVSRKLLTRAYLATTALK